MRSKSNQEVSMRFKPVLKRKKFLVKSGLRIIFGAMLSFTVLAWDGAASGQIDLVIGTGAGGMPFRVTLKGNPTLCGNTSTWAYLNDADGNYKTNTAILMSAKAQGSVVDLYSNRDSQGYCQIGYLQMH